MFTLNPTNNRSLLNAVDKVTKTMYAGFTYVFTD